jgi:hypothetical protein
LWVGSTSSATLCLVPLAATRMRNLILCRFSSVGYQCSGLCPITVTSTRYGRYGRQSQQFRNRPGSSTTSTPRSRTDSRAGPCTETHKSLAKSSYPDLSRMSGGQRGHEGLKSPVCRGSESEALPLLKPMVRLPINAVGFQASSAASTPNARSRRQSSCDPPRKRGV